MSVGSIMLIASTAVFLLTYSLLGFQIYKNLLKLQKYNIVCILVCSVINLIMCIATSCFTLSSEKIVDSLLKLYLFVLTACTSTYFYFAQKQLTERNKSNENTQSENK